MKSIKGRNKYNDSQGGTFLSLSLSRIKKPRTKVLFLIVPILIGLIASVFIISGKPSNQAHAAGNTYYVSPTGTDDAAHGTGTGANAWATLNYALTGSRVAKGDTIKIEAGTYDSFYSTNTRIDPSINTSTGSGPVIIESYSGSNDVTLNIPSNTNTSSAFLFFTSTRWVELTFNHINFTNTHSISTTLIWQYGHNAVFNHCSIDMNNTGVGSRIGNDTEESNLTIVRSVIQNTTQYFNQRTDGGTVNLTIESNIIKSGTASLIPISKPTNVYVKNNTFTITSDNKYSVYVTASTADINVVNNIFYTTGDGDYVFWVNGTTPYQYFVDNPDKLNVTNNIWYKPSTNYTQFYYSGDYSTGRRITQDGTNHYIDPQFTNYEGGDYTIAAGSHICGLGSLADLPSGGDYNGDSWTGNDIGAYKCSSDNPGVTPVDEVSFTGDSIMRAAGYNPSCYTYFNEQTGKTYVDPAQAAISGTAIRDIYAYIDTVMINNSPNTMFLSVGINDLAREYAGTAEDYANQLLQLMQKIENWGATPIWLGLGSLNGYDPGSGPLDDTRVLAINSAMLTGCEAHGWRCGDYLSQMKLDSNWQADYYWETGNVHPNTTGQTIIGKIAEYQYYSNKGTIGTTKIDSTGSVRVYNDGKFRYKTGGTGTANADLSVSPTGGFVSDNYDKWLDISSITWNNTGNRHKAWTEESQTTSLTNTIHTVGDLEADKYYYVTVDSSTNNLTGSDCSIIDSHLACKSNSSGKITFTYTGTYSTHTFDVIEGDNSGPNIYGPTVIFNDNSATVSWTTDESSTSRVDYGFTENYVSMTEDTSMITEHFIGLTDLASCTEYHYRVYSKDTAGNERFSTDNTFTTTGCSTPSDGSGAGSWRYFAGAYATSASASSQQTSTTQAIPTTGTMDSSIRFDASNLFSGKSITKYLWDFGDGKTDEGKIVNHKYSSPGRYTIKVTGYDKDGNEYVFEQSIDISPEVPTIKNITSTNDTDLIIEGNGYKGDTIYLSIHSTPMELTSSVDDTGYWSYTINNASETLGEGDHTASAIDSFKLADNTELKSSASDETKFSFTVDNGKLKVEMEKSNRYKTIIYILAGIIVVGAIIFFVKRKSRR